MKIQLTVVSTKFGSPMGRDDSPVSGKCQLQKVDMFDGGYDRGGAYWGIGTQLWVAQDSEGNLCFTRAATRTEAKDLIRVHNPDVTFFR